MSHHTITIEPLTDVRGVCELAVVDRVDGEVVLICCLEHEVRPGATLAAVAVAYAAALDAVYVPEGGTR